MDDQNKNLILATALSALVIVVWMLLVPNQPPQTAPQMPPVASQTAPETAPATEAAGTAAPDTPAPENAAADAPRVGIDTPRLSGTISTIGGRIDDLALKDYRETLDPTSPLVRLLSPVGRDKAYYALYGWAPGGALTLDDVPGANTPWTAEGGGDLTVDHPAMLTWDNGRGLIFHRRISVDENYLFSVEQSVTNNTGAPVNVAPYGLVARHGKPEGPTYYIQHEGVVQMADGELTEIKYKKMPKLPQNAREGDPAEVANITGNGWIGFTDKYWMTALVPANGQAFEAVAKYDAGSDIYQTITRMPTQVVAPGATTSTTSRLFAGAKEWETIRAYQNQGGIDRFLDAIDWGWFFFLTKPIFAVLHWLNSHIHNMGLSILALTLCIKALLLPLAYKSYVSMARMKELQPELEKLKERAGDDKAKLQKEMMQLYRTKKVNPAAGCLPVVLQIPIFFSLYKVIFNTIELRHAPFFGWIRDLSAPDHSSILNLFGLLPFAPPAPTSPLAIISIGALPILLGISMWLQQKLNPAPADPTQKAIFAWMPWIFMFMLGRFASGLVLYWIGNNTITFMQQYLIMRSHGHKPNIFGNIRSGFSRKPATATAAPARSSKPAEKPAPRPAPRPRATTKPAAKSPGRK